MKKLIIIGAGPAGISAALYAKRGNIDTTVIAMDSTSLNMAHKIDNYYGLLGISGGDLYNIGKMQAQKLGIPVINDEVLSIEFNERYSIIGKNSSYDCDAIIIATGSYRKRLDIKGLKEYEGKGVSYCAVCDGFFFRKKRLAVIGNSSYALHEADYLSNLAKDVLIFTNGEEIEDEGLKKYMINKDRIEAINGDDIVRSIITNNGEQEVDGIFVASGSADALDLARKLGLAIDENNKIAVNAERETNLPNIFAAGDCTPGMMQIAKAVYDGAVAGTSAIKALKKGK